ncbi:hypothetical protein M406DRAFT_72595 [Cryphonectria parasitica EP155]|uniref:BTB domain-containing protein n=1 Tax=Cryphonectria parasitica (strain ATCC 38755 / EP155) TaxID=660469 RepID=A0A9P4XXA3_CRYP1|nr:uncharacterized protein M406DRAFT_72595 [Cryphonectria parasitica EP155]KAF3762608.1 hypothetical protein M406DRAFT_72595 [Cryphonectria parasitica EP155]
MAPKWSYSAMLKGARRPPQASSSSSKANQAAGGGESTTPTPLNQQAPSPPPVAGDLKAFPPLESLGAGKAQPGHKAVTKKGTDTEDGLPTSSAAAADDDNNNNNNNNNNKEKMSFLRAGEKEDLRVSPNLPEPAAFEANLPATRARAASGAPYAALWDKPDGADIIIRCKGLRWEVHRHILVEKSEYMEKYLPPEAEDGKPVEWNLDNWDAGSLGAVLHYMYIEDYEGGDFDPKNPMNTMPIVHAVANFLAGTSCLCRPMMDHTLTQIDAATEELRKVAPMLRYMNLDQFEFCLRRAMLMTYSEPDQWRIRALRIVMGKLMAVCFPLILQNPGWRGKYEQFWGMMRVRVVADHKWLSQAGICQRNHVIMAGFEHMSVLWTKYRGDGWQPSDDLIFPERELENLPAPPPLSPPPTTVGRKVSKAIPIKRPDGTIASSSGAASGSGSAGRSRGKKYPTGLVEPTPQPPRKKGKNYPTGLVEPTPPSSNKKGKNKRKSPEQAAAETKEKDKADTPSTTNVSSPSTSAGPSTIKKQSASLEGSFGTGSATSSGPVVPDATAPAGSAAWWAHISDQPYPFLPPPPFRSFSVPTSPQSLSPRPSPGESIFPGGGMLPDGSYFFKETSTGEPSDYASSEATGPGEGSRTRDPSVAAPAEHMTDPLDSLANRVAALSTEEAAGDTTPPVKGKGKGKGKEKA